MTQDPSAEGRLDPAIAAYYEQGQEQHRLGSGAGRLEFVRTLALLERFLPSPPATVVDVGGGAGVYALPLARRGYTVHLIDPVPLHIDQAVAASAEQPDAELASATIGDARALPWPDMAADAVLLLGPLYHLTARPDRVAALAEARRVTRPPGVVAVAAISRYASTYSGLFHGFLDEPGFEDIVARDVLDGQHRNPSGRPEWFTTAFLHHPDELVEEVAEAGLELRKLAAVEGPGSEVPDLDDRLADPGPRERLLRAIRRVEGERTLLGASPHLMAIARRR